MKIGQKISTVRKQKGYTQESLAEATNLSLSTIKRIEKGKVVPRIHTLKTLSAVLDLDLLVNQTKEEMPKMETNHLSLILLFSATLVFLPPLHIIFLLSLWRNKKSQSFFNTIGKDLLSFQTITFILLMLSIGLVPLFIFILTGQKMYGQLNIPLLAYSCFVLVNIGRLSLIYHRRTKERFTTA